MSRTIDNAYESIKSYLPEDAKSVIDNQRKRIEKDIDIELENFQEEFSNKIKQVVVEIELETERTIKKFNGELSAITNKMRQEVSDNAELNSAVQVLSGQLDQYDAVVTKLAAATKKAIKVAANTAGLPI
jgi:hypothetical protein